MIRYFIGLAAGVFWCVCELSKLVLHALILTCTMITITGREVVEILNYEDGDGDV
jgi:hypothetical protein